MASIREGLPVLSRHVKVRVRTRWALAEAPDAPSLRVLVEDFMDGGPVSEQSCIELVFRGELARRCHEIARHVRLRIAVVCCASPPVV